jgi:hypothetical protein
MERREVGQLVAFEEDERRLDAAVGEEDVGAELREGVAVFRDGGGLP